MSGEYQVETRRRSRSKTPFLRSSCDHEACEHAGEEGHVHHHHQHQKKKTPNVQTIVEETVEVTSSSTAPGRAAQAATATISTKTSDYSSEDTSPENKLKKIATEAVQQRQSSQQQHQQIKTSSSTTTVFTKTKKLTSSGGAATSTPKSANYMVNSFASQFSTAGSSGGSRSETSGAGRRAKEIAQNELNTEFERSQRAAAVNSSSMQSSKSNRSFGRFFGSPFAATSAAGEQTVFADVSDHIAYREYKRAGEYWKTTPKTDYTYSELSPHRRVLAPGVIAMPNMSRRSLENHHERINYMIERDPAQEEYIRRRYETSKYTQNRRDTEKLLFDSGDELDYQYDAYRKQQQQNYYNGKYKNRAAIDESWITRFITTIITTVTSVWTSIVSVNEKDTPAYESTFYRTKYANEQRGFFGSIAHGISSAFLGLLRGIYLLISTVLCWDTWLLQSSNAENKSKKRFLIFLLLLLPLLLLGGLHYYLHPNEPFPPKSFSEYTFTLPTLPSLPKIDVSEYLNQENYEAIKSGAYNRLDYCRAWTADYLLYLRTVTQNIADEGRKLFQREEYFERA